MILIDRILACGALHLDGEFQGRLIDVVILTVGLEAVGQHLHPQFSIRDAVVAGLSFGIGLELKSAFFLLVFAVYRMQHNRRVPQGLAVVVLQDDESELGGISTFGANYMDSGEWLQVLRGRRAASGG